MIKMAKAKTREKGPLDGLVKDIITKWRKEKKEKGIDLMAAWKKAAGAKASRRSRPIRMDRGRLLVNTDNSGWLYELTLKKKEILKRLNCAIKGRKKVREIRFRIGDAGKAK